MKRTILNKLACGLVASTALGCGAAPDDGTLDSSDLGDDSAALCTDPVWADATFNLAVAVAGLSTSKDARYGTSACVGRYLVDLGNTTNRSFTSWADWGDVAATATNCGHHYVTARMDAFLPPTSAFPLGRWVSISADRTARGTFANGVCANRLDLTALQGLTPYSKVRIAARAYTMQGDGFIFQVPAKVSVGFKQTTGGGY